MLIAQFDSADLVFVSVAFASAIFRACWSDFVITGDYCTDPLGALGVRGIGLNLKVNDLWLPSIHRRHPNDK